MRVFTGKAAVTITNGDEIHDLGANSGHELRDGIFSDPSLLAGTKCGHVWKVNA